MDLSLSVDDDGRGLCLIRDIYGRVGGGSDSAVSKDVRTAIRNARQGILTQ